jgi:hypothetical protein
MNPGRWIELLTLVPAVVRIFRECSQDSPAERREAAEKRIMLAAERAHARRRAK